MHHLKETVIDGVKFVLIPEELHDKLAAFMHPCRDCSVNELEEVCNLWQAYDPEIFDVL